MRIEINCDDRMTPEEIAATVLETMKRGMREVARKDLGLDADALPEQRVLRLGPAGIAMMGKRFATIGEVVDAATDEAQGRLAASPTGKTAQQAAAEEIMALKAELAGTR